ncbi:F-box-like domain superfamily [Arabidopsis suecica]|uniref:F-box-like domain superfamily n=1 Tax=Arabidopsis suecica TaxID=45249 RepID=A0A8T2AJB8_ARASU|nr:F-box-like domain superfamily [Arabidopsis suecica]
MAKKRRPPRVHPLVSSKFARVLASSAVVLSSTSKPFSSAGALVSSLTSDIVDSAVPVETKRTLPSTPGVAPESAVVSENSSTLVTPSLPGSSSSDKAILNYSSNCNLSHETMKNSSSPDLPWESKFKTSLRNLKQMSHPTFLEDGTPVVVAPPKVLLKAGEMWKGHIVAQFHGLYPPSTKIFSDLNPIWGRYGNITVRIISETVALIFIPSVATREWVFDIGFWQTGNCSCTVYPWSPEGISVIASGIVELLHTERSRLDPINIGTMKVKVVIQLDKTLPSTVVVKDVQRNIARVAVEYPRPPPKCLNCGRYEVSHPTVILSPAADNDMNIRASHLDIVSSRLIKPRRGWSRSKNRARSIPPRIYEPTCLEKEKLKPVTSVGKGKEVILTSEVDITSPCLVKSNLSGNLVIHGSQESASLTLTTDLGKQPDNPFPLPPGWGAMYAKAQKKYKKFGITVSDQRVLESLFPSEASPRVEQIIIESSAFAFPFCVNNEGFRKKMDRINGLSDDIICHILSFLPIKESALTCVLSKRWRKLFAFTPNLLIDYDLVVGSGQSFIDFMDRVLTVSGSFPIRRISIKCRKRNNSVGHVPCWMIDALKRGVVDLDIDITVHKPCLNFCPLEIFTCKTMVELKLAKGFNAKIPDDVSLPSLKTLFLDSISFYNTKYYVLGKLISACPVLEELTICGSSWMNAKDAPIVSSSTLKKLTIKCPKFNRLSNSWGVTFDTPSLAYLEYTDLVPREYPIVNLESLVEAKLDLSCYLGSNPTNLIKGLRNVEVLELSSIHTSVGSLLHVNKCKEGYGLSCPVKVLKITEYGGTDAELEQMKHFLERLSCLELVKVRACAIRDKEKLRITNDLLMVPRSSKCNIQIMFYEKTK